MDSTNTLYWNFVVMAICFSANHGAVTSVIALASSFDPTLGSYSVGILYGMYVLTAMFIGPYVVTVIGSKQALVTSLSFYTVYVASYLFASLFKEFQWYLVIFGATVGGIGAGLLWTSQGSYFKVNAMRYAQAHVIKNKENSAQQRNSERNGENEGMGGDISSRLENIAVDPMTEEQASSLFSSIFASWYLGLEVSLTSLGSLAAKYGSHSSLYIIYALYSIICVVSSLAMTKVLHMDPSSSIVSSTSLIGSSSSLGITVSPLAEDGQPNTITDNINASLDIQETCDREILPNKTQEKGDGNGDEFNQDNTKGNAGKNEAVSKSSVTFQDNENHWESRQGIHAETLVVPTRPSRTSDVELGHRRSSLKIAQELTLSDSIKLVTAALSLLLSNPKCSLMAPTNFAFGFASAFITSYIGGSVVAPMSSDRDDDEGESYHDSQVLFYASLAAAVATLLTFPGFGFHLLRLKAGTRFVMLIGAVSFISVATIALVFEGYDLRHLLWLVYVLYGAGRSVWENTVKAIFADFFSEADSQAAFANIILQSGSSAALGFFLYPSFSAHLKCWLVIICSALGYICFLVAHGKYLNELDDAEVERRERSSLLHDHHSILINQTSSENLDDDIVESKEEEGLNGVKKPRQQYHGSNSLQEQQEEACQEKGNLKQTVAKHQGDSKVASSDYQPLPAGE